MNPRDRRSELPIWSRTEVVDDIIPSASKATKTTTRWISPHIAEILNAPAKNSAQQGWKPRRFDSRRCRACKISLLET